MVLLFCPHKMLDFRLSPYVRNCSVVGSLLGDCTRSRHEEASAPAIAHHWIARCRPGPSRCSALAMYGKDDDLGIITLSEKMKTSFPL